MELSGQSNAKPLILECGGKSPHVVFKDASELEAVANAVVENLVWNQGQVCSAHSRLIAHVDIKDQLTEMIVSRAARYHPSDPLDESTVFGPLGSPAQRDRVKAYIEHGIRLGANAVLKGRIQESGGCYVYPTVFTDVDESMSIVRDEIFGPVLCVQSFTTEEDAIASANATDYGLSATVWTRDMGRGRRMAQALRAGAISIRTSGEESPDPGYLFGFEPQKASGFGSEMGIKGLESYSNLKLISFNGV